MAFRRTIRALVAHALVYLTELQLKEIYLEKCLTNLLHGQNFMTEVERCIFKMLQIQMLSHTS